MQVDRKDAPLYTYAASQSSLTYLDGTNPGE